MTDSTIQPELSLIRLSILHKISWKDLSRSNLWFITVFVVELKKTGENSISVPLSFFDKSLTVIWYLKPFVLSKRSLSKSLILDLLASNWIIRSFFYNEFNFVWLCISWRKTTKYITMAIYSRSFSQIIGGSGSGKTNALLNLIKQQDYSDKIYLDAKDLSKSK